VIDQVFTVMALTPRNTYQVLTKARRGCGTTAPAGCEIRARRSISNAGRRKPMSGFPCSCKRRRGSLAGGEHVQRPQVRRGPRQGREASGTKRGKKYCKRAPALTILLKGGTPAKSLK